MSRRTAEAVCGWSAALAFLIVAATEAHAVTIDWVPVGNPGNPADTAVMTFDGTTSYGSVGYSYNIGKYDVTNSQYVEFLNAKDPTGANSLALYSGSMSFPPYGGINFISGNAIGGKYSIVAGRGNWPVNYTSWYSAIRFTNWMNNGQGNGDTESGAYTLLGGTPTPSNGLNITRNPGAQVFLPSENEWYKAAYYNPGTNSYFLYPTSSNTVPTASGPTALPEHANFAVGGASSPTDVGAYSGTTSPFGAFDMSGNVFQWNEALITVGRGLRGGSFHHDSSNLLSSHRGFEFASLDTLEFAGFRVASVPEPSTLILAAWGLVLIARRMRSH